MAFPKKKVYGQSQAIACPFCGQQSTTKNSQGLPVCRHHSKEEINLRCLCKEWLDVRKSKYGVFFSCINCGAVSYSKGLEINNLPLKSIDNI